jgi:hypothetical protein
MRLVWVGLSFASTVGLGEVWGAIYFALCNEKPVEINRAFLNEPAINLI